MQDIFQYSKGCQVLKELLKQGESDGITGFSGSISFPSLNPSTMFISSRGQGIEFVDWVKMKEVAKVLPSKMRDFILIKACTKPETGFVI